MELKQSNKFIEKAAHALSDKCRLAIVQEIAARGSLLLADAQEMTELSQPCVSHHVKVLTDSDLVLAVKEGRSVRLSINKNRMKELSQFVVGLI